MLGMKVGTKVINPTHRRSDSGYTECLYCKRYYTKLGAARHWGRCPENPKNKQRQIK